MLFINSYVSTDFDVHLNWLAITQKLPISRWYLEEGSQWTLDYPPFFAYFECALSCLVAPLFSISEALTLPPPTQTDFKTQIFQILLFQKLSVIATDLIYVIAIFKLLRVKPFSSLAAHRATLWLFLLAVLAPFSLLLIDHIHFQYNGMLTGVLFLCIYSIYRGHSLVGATCFMVLLNLKHIYLYYAPAILVFFVFGVCFEPTQLQHSSDDAMLHNSHTQQQQQQQNEEQQEQPISLIQRFQPIKFAQLCFLAIAMFLLAYAPFLYHGQFDVVLSRMFPFKRGLTHSYWAPNVWALYNALDLLLNKLLRQSQSSSSSSAATANTSASRGLIGQSTRVLPNLAPIHTLLVALLFLVPIMCVCACRLIALPRGATRERFLVFLRSLILSGWIAFEFGWHVHEKAAILITLPFLLLIVFDRSVIPLALPTILLLDFSLLPLLPGVAELSLKISLFIASSSTLFCLCEHLFADYRVSPSSPTSPSHSGSPSSSCPPSLFSSLHPVDRVGVLIGIPLIGALCFCVLPLAAHWLNPERPNQTSIAFLPLLLMSSFTAALNLFAFLRFYVNFLFSSSTSSSSCFASPFSFSFFSTFRWSLSHSSASPSKRIGGDDQSTFHSAETKKQK